MKPVAYLKSASLNRAWLIFCLLPVTLGILIGIDVMRGRIAVKIEPQESVEIESAQPVQIDVPSIPRVTSLPVHLPEVRPAVLPVKRLEFESESSEAGWWSKIDPEKLKKYEGSSTTDELLTGSGDPLSFGIDSRWLYKNTNSPQIRMRIQKNPDTGDFEPVGGEVEFSSGIGVGYEEDHQSGEWKTFFKFKKDF